MTEHRPLHPEMDFAALPIADLAQELRTWADALLAALLEDRPAPPSTLPILAAHAEPWNPPRQAALRYAARALTGIAGIDDAARTAILHNPLALIIGRALGTDTWRERIADRWARVLRPAVRRHLPPELWALLGTLAWEQPQFQRRVAERIRARLRERTLIFDGALPSPRLRPEVFWCLLELVGPRRLRHTPGRRGLARVIDRVVNEALHGGPAWGGFWEQWLLAEALGRWRPCTDGIASPLRQVLAAMPILEWPKYARLKTRLSPARDGPPPSTGPAGWRMARGRSSLGRALGIARSVVWRRVAVPLGRWVYARVAGATTAPRLEHWASSAPWHPHWSDAAPRWLREQPAWTYGGRED